jgi:CheY-like chemotaxis protein
MSGRAAFLCLAELFEMRRQARLLAGAAGLPGFREIAQVADALEALFIRLYGEPTNITPSVIRTIGQAIDLLTAAFDSATKPAMEMPVSPAILVVDDEVISREAICSAIERANLRAISLDDPMVAEDLLQKTHFDLIFLDVEMPGQSGLDLCAKIRKMTTNRTTPVVFVTAHCDFESRAQSVLSGGNDFIAKPFLSVELAVKVLVWLFKRRVPPLSMARPANLEDRLVELSNEPARASGALAAS